jgi:carboxyl-terminal processing protease
MAQTPVSVRIETTKDQLMPSTTRRLVLWISAPVVAFAIVGGFLTQVLAREDTYQRLKIFDDVVGLINSNYVEPADIDKVMAGAMRGLADSLDADSAFLTPEQVKVAASTSPLPTGEVGLELTRQYYLRVIAARDGSAADRAGLRTGDYVRAIGETPTRQMSVFEGMRALRGAPGSTVKLTVIRGNTNDPHVVELTREVLPPSSVTRRIAAPRVGYVRIAAIGQNTAGDVRNAVAELTKSGAASLIVDVRRTSTGTIEQGIAIARLFVPSGTLVRRQTKGVEPQEITAQTGESVTALPVMLLVDAGTSGAAEVLGSALVGNSRAELIGEPTIGRAAEQTLVRLPTGAGLWLTTTRYLTPNGDPLHEEGLRPAVVVEQPFVEFGQPPPTTDPILDRALERIAARPAA